MSIASINENSYSDSDDGPPEEKNHTFINYVKNEKSDSEENKELFDLASTTFKDLRPYQKEIYENSRDRNGIIYLETGTGKTFISMMLSYYYLVTKPEKKIIMLANTVQLVRQQYSQFYSDKQYIHKEMKKTYGYMKEKIYTVKEVNSHIAEDERDLKKFFEGHYKNTEILVLTPQSFLNWLRRAYVLFDDFALIILDECHHTNLDHPYNQIMKEFYFERKKENKENPFIIGLTASPLLPTFNQYTYENIEISLLTLCKNLDSNFINYDTKKVDSFLKKSTTVVETYNEDDDEFNEKDLKNLEMKFKKNKVNSLMELLTPEQKVVQEIYEEFIKRLSSSIYDPKKTEKKDDIKLKMIIEEVNKFLTITSLRIIYELGLSSYYDFFHACIQNPESEDENSNYLKGKKSEVLEFLEQNFRELFHQFLKDKYEDYVNKNQKLSIKSNTLIKLLKDYVKKVNHKIEKYKDSKETYDKPQIIIFVERRFIASNLNKLIQKCFINEEEGSKNGFKLNGGYVIGFTKAETTVKKLDLRADDYGDYKDFNNQKEDVFKFVEKHIKLNALPVQSIYNKRFNEIQVCMEHQIQMINKFKEKSLNLLVATSVAEEGFDIPNCNLVIAYNEVSNFNSFIQLRGRARKEDSKFIIMVTENKKRETVEEISKYERIIEVMRELIMEIAKCKGGFEEYLKSNKKVMKDKVLFDNEPFYKKIKIKQDNGRETLLNTNWSMMLLASYCTSQKKILRGIIEKQSKHFDNEKEITNRPIYIIKYINEVGYACHIVLPIKKDMRFYVFRGNFVKTKSDAKKYAAFELIKFLYKKEKVFNKNLTLKKNTIRDEDLIEADIDRFIEEEEQKKENKEKTISLRQKIKNKFIKHENLKYYFYFTTETFKPNFFKSLDEKYNFYFYSIEIMRENDQPLIGDVNKTATKLGFIYFGSYFKEEIGQGKYFIEPDTRLKMEIRYLTRAFTIDPALLEKIRLIDSFLWSIIRDEDLNFFSIMTNEEIDPEGHYKGCYKSNKKKTKHKPLKFINDENFLMLMLLTNDNPPVLDYKKYEEIESYINLLKKYYFYYNKLKNKTNNQPYVKLDLNLEFCKEFNKNPNYFIDDLTNPIVIQSITTFQKSIIKYHFNLNDISLDNLAIKSETENKTAKILKKKKNIERYFNYKIVNDDYLLKNLLTYKIFDNFLKELLKLPPKYIIKEADRLDNLAFNCEFLIFPLNYSFLLTLFFIDKYFMILFRDFIKTCRFKKKLLKMMIDKKPEVLGEDINSQIKNFYNYTINIDENYIFKEINNLSEFLNKNPELLINKEMFKKTEKKIKKMKKIEQEFINPPIVDFKNLDKSIKIYPTILRSSLMTRNYNLLDNYEKLEFFGDTVLKALSTIQVFCNFPKEMEGFLHIERNKIINNNFLSSKSIIYQFFKYVLNDKLNFVPPCYFIEGNLVYHDPKYEFKISNKKSNEDKKNEKENEKKAPNKKIFEFPENYSNLANKSLADIIEAMTAVIYISNNKSLQHCHYFLYCLGILEKPALNLKLEINNKIDYDSEDYNKLSKNFLSKYENIQNRIGYKFKNFGLLIQCFTHISFKRTLEFYSNKDDPYKYEFLKKLEKPDLKEINLTDSKLEEKQLDLMNEFENHKISYERLEFLGDAVIDLFVNEYLFDIPEDSPGKLTMMKQSIVNNMALSLIALHFDFDELVITDEIKFIEKIKQIKENLNHYYINIDEYYEMESSHIKTLGDLFEAFVGGLFIDCNFDYHFTKNILKNMIYEKFVLVFTSEEYLKKLPEAKIKQILSERGIENTKIIKKEKMNVDGKFEYVLTDNNEKEIFSVFAINLKQALNLFYENLKNS